MHNSKVQTTREMICNTKLEKLGLNYRRKEQKMKYRGPTTRQRKLLLRG
jgi:hypothetical protein